MNIDLKSVKSYLRIDEDDDDPLLEILIESAEQSVIDGTRPDVDKKDKRYILATMMIVGHWYENRGVVSPNASNIPFGVISIMTLLSIKRGAV